MKSMPEINLQEPPMNHKPFFDAREQRVESVAETAEEQARRNAGIEAIGHMVNEQGFSRVMDWLYMTETDPRMAALVNTFGVDLVRRWINYYGWREPRYPTPSLRGQVLSQVAPDRPSDRCLADGAALVNHICVQCGRDNS